MRRMIPQKLIDELTARLEREEQTKEMLENIEVAVDLDSISGYAINLVSDGDTYLTITVEAIIDAEDETNIELKNIPTNFLIELLSAQQLHLATNSLGSSEVISVKSDEDCECIVLTISDGAPRNVYSTITLSNVRKEL